MLVKKLDERFHRCFDLEMALNPGATCAAVADAQFGIPGQYFQRIGEEPALARVHQQAGFLVYDRFRNAGRGRRNDRARGSHRFENHRWKNIARAMVVDSRGQREDVAAAQFLQDAALRQSSLERDAIAEPQLVNLLLQTLAQRTVSDDFAMELDVALAQLLARFDQILETLEGDEPPDAQDFHGPALSGVRRLVQKIAEIHSVVDAVDFRRRIRAALHY